MSSSILNKELDFAFAQLDQGPKTEKKQKAGHTSNKLGTKRHGITKRMKKLSSKKKNTSSSLALKWKFADPSKYKEDDLTDSCLKVLAKLDQQTKVSSKQLVHHHQKEKRQLPIDDEQGTSKLDNEEGSVFTDADFERLEKEYFLNSKSAAPVSED